MLFQGLINDAKAAVGSVIATYLARASVAVPFIAAAGFATAAMTFLLAEQFGVTAACWIVAGGFTAIGAVAALFVGIKEQEEAAASAEAAAEEEGVVNGAMEAVEQAVRQSPVELASALLLSTPLGPRLLAGGMDSIRRNWPLVVLAALIALLFWAEDLESSEGDAPKPNGADTTAPEDHLAPEHLSPEPAYAGWPQ
jgi:hypothetical protein